MRRLGVKLVGALAHSSQASIEFQGDGTFTLTFEEFELIFVPIKLPMLMTSTSDEANPRMT